MEQVVYGHALALFQLGREMEAQQTLREAIEFLPLVAEGLARSYHLLPRDLHPDRVTHGGRDQAYYYWQDQGQYWKNTPGAIEFVRGQVSGSADPTQRRFSAWLGQHRDTEAARQAKALPLRRDMVTLLEYVIENKVVGTQSTGNMPLKAVREVAARFVDPPELDTSIGERVFRLRSEAEVRPLYFLHVLAEVGDLLAIAPARRWRVTHGGEEFLDLDPFMQVLFLLVTWWHGANWLTVYPFAAMGDALPSAFERVTLTRLLSLQVEERVPFREFADGLIAETGLTWGRQDSSLVTLMLQASIERMVIEILASFDAVASEYRNKPLGRGTISELDTFAVTPFGKTLLEGVAVAGG